MKLRVLCVVVVAVVLGGCNLQPNDRTLPGQTAVGSDGYTVTVYFDEIANLVRNSEVQMDQVVIGTVADIDVEDWQAKVKLRLLESVDVPSDAVFSIGQKTLLGAQYVEVSPSGQGSDSGEESAELAEAPGPGTAGGTDGVTGLGHGDVISSDQTGTYPATEQVLGATSLLLNNGGLAQIHTVTSELSTALDDRAPDTRSLIRRSNELLGVLDENKSEVVDALDSLDRLSAGLAEDREVLGAAIEELGPGVQALEEERESLVTAVTETGRTGAQASDVIRASREATLSNLDSLRPVLTSLGEVAETLPDALKIALTIPFPAMTTDRALKGDYANLFTTIDVRGSSLVKTWLNDLELDQGDAGASSGEDSDEGSSGSDDQRGSRGTGSGTGSSPQSTPGSPTPSPSPSPSSGGCLWILGDC